MWTLLVLFALNGAPGIATEKIEGFKSRESCAEVAKWIANEYKNHNPIEPGRAEVVAACACIEIK